ncbi:GNAT family N-acetyltransferase [Paucibacter sp. Y2R2-4]|uniref:GNAT family N-acetyltransferase n=1 Tax=Paucibacter sp. Y2R2-4 TaxID=2893553 RepID=UPI0021E46F70|nr:GNAT family N-acetyltransferase [Paucibacter sp. Y2R2-4]MCV2350550.1 GNAT family N-acetyltransferase [Paucibacter sp. Y2R2-4]
MRSQQQYKKIGVVGGVAWASTVEYYRQICQWSQLRHRELVRSGTPEMPEFAIESVNIAESHGRRGVAGDEASWARFDAYFHAALLRLQASGADFALIASNTPHKRLEAIRRGVDIPVLSIFEVVAQACAAAGVSQLLILGTEPTMQGQALPGVLSRHGIGSCVPLDAGDRVLLAELIAELQAGGSGSADSAARQIGALAERAFAAAAQPQQGRRAVGLACTELPLAFPAQLELASFEHAGHFYINTSLIHARAAFEMALQDGQTLARRAATEADIPELLILRRQTFHRYMAEAGMAIDADTDLIRVRFQLENASVLLLGGQIVGLIKMSRGDAQDPSEWRIHQLQISPRLQGRGFGSTLMRELMAEAAAAGASLGLGVLKNNPAQALYRRLGFVDEGENEREFLLRWPAR